MKKIYIFLFAVCLLMCSCEADREDDFYGGKELDDAAISSIEAMLDETAAPKYTAETDASGNVIVFWTESGTVYHQSKSCSSLSKSKTVTSGAIAAAETAGKSRACSNCFD